EITLRGPTLRFNHDCAFIITGAVTDARLDDAPLTGWRAHHARAGQTLTLGDIQAAGCRSYLLLAGGLA
ncbi:allophanate hydrolase, partial [Dickeya dianthicola]|nr:allophanate hydrolase [Dickeya dianthicola]